MKIDREAPHSIRVDVAPGRDGTTGAESAADRLASRRRLIKAGLVAAPFILTLHALPARAGGGGGSLGLYGYDGGDRKDRVKGRKAAETLGGTRTLQSGSSTAGQ